MQPNEDASKAVYLLMKGAFSEFPQETQDEVNECIRKLKAVVAEYGDNGNFAIALIGAELAASL